MSTAMLLSEIEHQLELQGGVCAVCRQSPTELSIDPATRRVLCLGCWQGLQLFVHFPADARARFSAYLDTTGERSWDGYFLRMAALVASRSKDPSGQVGAVLVRDNQVVATGYNGFPRGVDDARPERFERPLKYTWTVHAEENAILSAARNGSRTDGTTLYVTPLYPCARCATSIVQAGVREVVSSDGKRDNPRWAAEFVQAETIFREAGVNVRAPKLG